MYYASLSQQNSYSQNNVEHIDKLGHSMQNNHSSTS